MGSALGCLGMRCKAGSMPTDGEAVPGVAACRRQAPFWPRNGFAASNSSAKQTGRCRGPHRGFKPAGRGVAAPETMASGGRRCARGQDVAGLLRAPGLRGSARGAPARLDGGSGRDKILRRRAIAREWTHRRGWRRIENLSAAWRKPWSCGPKEGRGALAKLRRG